MQTAALENQDHRLSERPILLDTTRLSEIREILSPSDLRKLIADVIHVVQNCTRAIRSTRGRVGDDTLRNAYDLYGTAANFGLIPLACAAERVVSSAKTGQTDDLPAQAGELVSVGETTVEALLIWIDQAAPEKAA